MTPPELPQIPVECHGAQCPDKAITANILALVSAVHEMREDFRDHVKEQADLIKTLTIIDTHVARYLGNARRGEVFEEIGEIRTQLKEHHDYITTQKGKAEVVEDSKLALRWRIGIGISIVLALLSVTVGLLK